MLKYQWKTFLEKVLPANLAFVCLLFPRIRLKQVNSFNWSISVVERLTLLNVPGSVFVLLLLPFIIIIIIKSLFTDGCILWKTAYLQYGLQKLIFPYTLTQINILIDFILVQNINLTKHSYISRQEVSCTQ